MNNCRITRLQSPLMATSSHRHIAAALAALSVLLACGQRRNDNRARPIPAISVWTVDRGPVVRTVRLLGTLQGEAQAMAIPKFAGRVTEIVRPEGSTVVEGEPILYIVNDVPGMDYRPGPVTAPVAGVVGRIYADVGQTVAPGQPVAAISRFASSVKARAAVSDADLPFIRRGAPAEVTVSTMPGLAFAGRVTGVSPIIDPMSRSATVEVTMANSERRLLPGMTVTIRLTLEAKPDVVRIPGDALLIDGSARVIVVSDRTAKIRPITTGLAGDDFIEVASGLEPGETVATTGKERVKDGDTVNPIEEGTR